MTHPSEFSSEQKELWKQWLDSRPGRVARVIEALPPWNLYRLKTTNHVVSILSYDEPEDTHAPITLKVYVGQDLNPMVLFSRQVFGIHQEDLEPIEEPA